MKPVLITIEEIQSAFRRCNPNRAPGLGGKRSPISYTKSEAVLLRGNLDPGRQTVVRVDGQRIRTEQTVKYLGVQVGTGMEFQIHLNETREKLVNRIAPLKRVLRREFGPHEGQF